MNNRVEELDFLRGISIVGVVVIHVFSSFVYVMNSNPGLGIYGLVLSQWTRFSVPMFLFVSAASLTVTHSNDFNYSKFLLRRIRIILVPYFIWSLVFEFNKGNLDSFSIPALFNILSDLVQGNAASQYYFIPLVMQFYILYPLFLWISATRRGFAGTAILFAVVQVSAILLLTTIEESGIKFPHAMEGFFLQWIFYFVLGCLWWSLRQNDEGTNSPLLTGLLLVLALIILPLKFFLVVGMTGVPRNIINQETQYFRGEMLSFFALTLPLLWHLAEIVKHKGGTLIKSTLKALGRYSFGIYLVHLFFINSVISACMKADGDFMKCILLTLSIPLIIAISMALLWFLDRIPILRVASTLSR